MSLVFRKPCRLAPDPLQGHLRSTGPIRIYRSIGKQYASTSSAGTRTRNLAVAFTGGFAATLGYYYVTDTRASIHQWLVVPVLRWLYPDAEDAHVAGNTALKSLWSLGLHPREREGLDEGGDLGIEVRPASTHPYFSASLTLSQVFGQTLLNPIGTSAGIDKNGEIPSPLLTLGPAVVEIGGVTPHPQDGNPTPRVFRLPSQRGLINRYGLNSEGADSVARRLRLRVREWARRHGWGHGEEAERAVLDGAAGVPAGSLEKGRLLAVQVAKNRTTPDADVEAVRADYVAGVEALGRYADIVVVNVSSPNTLGLRDLQRAAPLAAILNGVVRAAARVDRAVRPAVMVKVSPDEDTEEQVMGVCAAVLDAGVDGIIVGNTTTRRPDAARLPAAEARTLGEAGGYSGPQLFERTVRLVRRYRELLDHGMDIVGDDGPPKVIFATGGITNGKQALEVLNAGASVAMVYTALVQRFLRSLASVLMWLTAQVYGGVGTISRIKREMRQEIRKVLKS